MKKQEDWKVDLLLSSVNERKEYVYSLGIDSKYYKLIIVYEYGKMDHIMLMNRTSDEHLILQRKDLALFENIFAKLAELELENIGEEK